MEDVRYKEMIENVNSIIDKISDKDVFLFAHCEATLCLADYLIEHDIRPVKILDNSPQKTGIIYKGICVCSPQYIQGSAGSHTIVLIVSRFYEAMKKQLRKLHFTGEVIKLIDYNTYAEYSLSKDTIKRKYSRIEHGMKLLGTIKDKHKGKLIILCPFNALGDIYYCMSYIPQYLKNRKIADYVLCVQGTGCKEVAMLFGHDSCEVIEPRELDAIIQSAIYTQDDMCFIAHQDRPYVVNLHKMLSAKKITLEQMYRIGVFGLDDSAVPKEPMVWKDWDKLDIIKPNEALILAPYAKSVPPISDEIWESIIKEYSDRGYQIFTSVYADEKPLEKTMPLRASLNQMKSIVERAGTFIAIRSGLCDVLRSARCKKVALYPDYNYCDTKYKAIDIYPIDGFENVAVDKLDMTKGWF